MLEEQCRREGYKQSLPFTTAQFTKSGRVSLSLNPVSISGWNWSYCGVSSEYVSSALMIIVYCYLLFL